MQFKIVTGGDMSGNITSKVMDLGQVQQAAAIQSVFSGSPAGSLKLQISNDIIAVSSDPNTGVTNWDDYGNAYTIAAAGSYTFNIGNIGYRWARLVFTASGGSTGTLNSTASLK